MWKKTLLNFLGATAFGFTGYVIYLYYFHEDEEISYYHDPLAKVSKMETIEFLIQKKMLPDLIGKNGNIIKEFQDRYQTQITFGDEEYGREEVTCTISGSAEACNIAENLIRDFINRLGLLESEDVWVIATSIGKIIGRGGQNIREIRSLSGAQVKVNEDEAGLPSKRLTIKGSREQINMAKLLIKDIVEEVAQSQQMIQESLARREPRLPPKSPENISSMESPRVERISPCPGYPDTQFEVYVSAMVDPSRFWVQIVGPKATELDYLVDEMTEYYGLDENRSMHPLQEVKKGDLVAASFQYDNKWYRAEVLDVLEEDQLKQALLYYVDYGDTDTVPCSDMYELRTDFLRLHFQAIECFLARVEPTGETWSEEAIDKFEEWAHVAQWKKLFAKMNGYNVREKTRAKREGSPVPGIDLYEFDEHDFDIGEELVKNGLAVYKKDEILNSSSRATSNSNISVASSS